MILDSAERILIHIGEPGRPPPVSPARGPPEWEWDFNDPHGCGKCRLCRKRLSARGSRPMLSSTSRISNLTSAIAPALLYHLRPCRRRQSFRTWPYLPLPCGRTHQLVIFSPVQVARWHPVIHRDVMYAGFASLQGRSLLEQCTTPGMEEVGRLRRQSRGAIAEEQKTRCPVHDQNDEISQSVPNWPAMMRKHAVRDTICPA